MKAVDDVSFSVDEGEIVVIVGESGCGKTTTLRCIAGLETPTSGTIRIEGRTVTAPGVFVPPEKRGVGMVFQSYALWPHKTVFDNVAYTLMLRRAAQGRDPPLGRRACFPWSGLAGSESDFRPCSVADSSNAWRWPAALSRAPRSCCSTSR